MDCLSQTIASLREQEGNVCMYMYVDNDNYSITGEEKDKEEEKEQCTIWPETSARLMHAVVTALKAGGRGSESHLSSLFLYANRKEGSHIRCLVCL